MAHKKTEKFKIGNLEAGETDIINIITFQYVLGRFNRRMVYAESELGFKADAGALLTIEYYEDALKIR